MRKENSKFLPYYVSEAGAHLVNRDYYAFVELDHFACYVLADGLDSDAEYNTAKSSVTSVLRMFIENPSMGRMSLTKLLVYANAEIKAESKNFNHRASIMIVVTDYTRIRYAQSGNVRFTLLRNGNVAQSSLDQSMASQYLLEDMISRDKVSVNEERNNLYCYLGQPNRDFKPFISKKLLLSEGDIICIYTRGIWENLDESELLDASEESKESKEFVDLIEDLLLTKQPIDLENYTFVSIYVDKIYIESKEKKKTKRLIIIVSILLVVAIIVLFVVLHFVRVARDKQIEATRVLAQNAWSDMGDGNIVGAKDTLKIAYDSARIAGMLEAASYKEYLAITELIDTAESKFSEGSYSDASDAYATAEAKSYNADKFGYDYITKRKQLVEGFLDVMDYISSGDIKMQKEDYSGAYSDYTTGLENASKIYFWTAKEELKPKIDECLAKIKEQDVAKLNKEAEGPEMTGDSYQTAKKYTEALDSYRKASELYAKAGNNDKVAEITTKIQTTIAAQAAEAERVQKEEENRKQQEEADRLAQIELNKQVTISQGKQKEMEGDQYMRNEYYEAAIEAYKKAYDIFLSVNDTALADGVSAKYMEAIAMKNALDPSAVLTVPTGG